MWIKICANTNLDDALKAAELGADAVGFVFAPSTRQMTVTDVARITQHLPEGLESVGVFPALSAQEIANAAQESGLSAVQLHGGVNLQLVRQLDELFTGQVRIIQTVHWDVDSDGASAALVAQQLREIAADGVVDRVLIDSKAGSATGGTGVSYDWSAATTAFAEAGAGLKLIVAGGLRPDNIAEAIRKLDPWGVDVASGVEESPGRKSPEKLAAFIHAARNTNST
jgi:phosphoribosylanthranilate isomerase